MPTRPTKSVFLVKEDTETTQRNMLEIQRQFSQLCPVCRGRETPVLDLVSGDNSITVPITNPRARITVFLDSAITLYDKGLNSAGAWVVNASGAAKARFIFY